MSRHPGRTSLRSAAVCLLVLGVGCATLGLPALVAPRFERADEMGSRIRLLPPDADRPAGSASLRMWTRVENPNPIKLTVSDLDGTLYVDDTPIKVSFPLGVPLAAQGDSVIPLDVTVGLADVPRLAEIAARAFLTGVPVNYRMEGTIGVDAGHLGAPRFGPTTILRGELQPLR